MQSRIGYFRSYGAFWKHYADFSSRTPKEAFWKAWVVHSVAMLALVSPIYYIYYSIIEKGNLFASLWILPLVAYSFATLVPTIAIVLRRLHDTDRNGCWFFLYLIPYAGIVAFFVMLTRPSAPYDVFPGVSGRGPYSTGQLGGPLFGQQDPGRPYSQQQDQDPGRPYSQAQSPYSPSYGQPPAPYGQALAPQPRSPYGQGQAPYYAQPYMQQPYALPPVYRRPPSPRRFAPAGGGSSAATAIVVSIVLAAASMAYGIVASAYFQNNIDKYASSLFGGSFWGDYFGNPHDNYDYWGSDPGSGDNPEWNGGDSPGWDYDDGWGGGDGNDWGYGGGDGYSPNDNGYMTEEKLAAIDHVRDSTLEGFPDFTIEDVLLAYVNEDGLVWDCNANEGDDPQDLFVTAFGIADGSFESIFADFFVYEDGTVSLYDLGYGNRWENEKDAMELYAELYDGMMLHGDADA